MSQFNPTVPIDISHFNNHIDLNDLENWGLYLMQREGRTREEVVELFISFGLAKPKANQIMNRVLEEVQRKEARKTKELFFLGLTLLQISIITTLIFLLTDYKIQNGFPISIGLGIAGIVIMVLNYKRDDYHL